MAELFACVGALVVADMNAAEEEVAAALCLASDVSSIVAGMPIDGGYTAR